MAKLRCMGCMREYEEKKKCCPYCGYVKGARPEYSFALQPETILQARYVAGKVLRCGQEELIYLGWDQVLDKRIVIKEYYPQLILHREEGQRQVERKDTKSEEDYRAGKMQYILDARELAKFREETGIIRIYDYFEQNGTVYVITEYSENYRRQDVATKMLYQKTDRKKKERYLWRAVIGVEATACVAVLVCAAVFWMRPYTFTATESMVVERMPDVSGETYEQAKQELEQLGIRVQREDCEAGGILEGTVVEQSKQMREVLSGNTTVTLWVSNGMETDTTAKGTNGMEGDGKSDEEVSKNQTGTSEESTASITQDASVDQNTTTSGKTGTTAQTAKKTTESKTTEQKTKKNTDGKKTTEQKAKKNTDDKKTTEQSTEVIVIED
ncbi:MAG: PASTA domain-containing protein [Lachnospiraceae bacterium]|nr:PASTA domain-containing protein [Lachnospiraceae bacterium]